MAHRNEIKTVPADEVPYPKCELCGWTDRKLRNVALSVTPLERIIIHKWARHGHLLPDYWTRKTEPPIEDGA